MIFGHVSHVHSVLSLPNMKVLFCGPDVGTLLRGQRSCGFAGFTNREPTACSLFWAYCFLTFCLEGYSENLANFLHRKLLDLLGAETIQMVFNLPAQIFQAVGESRVSSWKRFRTVPKGQKRFLTVSVSVGSRWTEGSGAVSGDGADPVN